MENLLIAAILLILVGAAIVYLVKAKKNGAKCIGCPSGGNCRSKAGSSAHTGCSCGCHSEK